MLWNDDPCRLVAGLRLGVWAEAETRVLPRLVPSERAGPLALPVEVAAVRAALGGAAAAEPPGTPPPLAWDIGIALGHAVGLVNGDLVEAWAVDRPTIWRAAHSNLDRRPDPPTAPIEAPRGPAGLDGGGSGLLLVCGGAWSTGWLTLGRTRATAAIAVADDLVVLGDGPIKRILTPLLTVAGRLAALRPDAWPPVPLSVGPGDLSPGGRFWKDDSVRSEPPIHR